MHSHCRICSIYVRAGIVFIIHTAFAACHPLYKIQFFSPLKLTYALLPHNISFDNQKFDYFRNLITVRRI